MAHYFEPPSVVLHIPPATAGDLIVGRSDGAFDRLAIGSNGQILSVVGGVVTWGEGPLTTLGDLLIGATGAAPTRLGIGTNGQVLAVAGGVATWKKAPLDSVTAQLAAQVVITNANQYYDGPTISLTAGTWFVSGTITSEDPAAAGGVITAQLWDGTTVTASSVTARSAAGQPCSLSLSGIVVLAVTSNVRISVASNQANGRISAAVAVNGVGNNASTISAVRLA